MSYLFVNLYEHHPGKTFEPDDVVQRFKDAFPHGRFAPEDQLEVRAREAERVLNPRTAAEQAVLTRLRRDAREEGPARSFTVVLEGRTVRGVVKRHLLQMTYDAPLSEEAANELKSVVRSLFPAGEKIVIEEES